MQLNKNIKHYYITYHIAMMVTMPIVITIII